ncbi:MAG TPA: tRNA (adenosine(37)-N6)-threonylcarbamoyltransferase complex ATPase subunit type 1 TsaE [Gemmatimonadaceae bacterium]|jgi:tRNA threonylcarbamoyladenosine biosynthesis protein TsaE|nr:tRNA (adenosine(37)-N6)-threonylcarbamoyltransferase complex ATPase subunit type 1 TsaE [Gemmatimonadaceae bacterium]
MPAHRHLVPPRADRGHLKLTEGELRHWGEELGRSISPPLLVTLTGELGVGKTTLAQAICLGYGVRDEITSPTYALIHEYHAPKSAVFHIDLYRLDSPDQLTNLGWDEIVSSRSLILVEWPERAGSQLPDDHLPIDLDYARADPLRRILLAG